SPLPFTVRGWPLGPLATAVVPTMTGWVTLDGAPRSLPYLSAVAAAGDANAPAMGTSTAVGTRPCMTSPWRSSHRAGGACKRRARSLWPPSIRSERDEQTRDRDRGRGCRAVRAGARLRAGVGGNLCAARHAGAAAVGSPGQARRRADLLGRRRPR